MTIDEALELKAGDTLTDVATRHAVLVVLGPVYSDFASPHPSSQWRLPVVDLENGRRQYWPNGRFDELEAL